MSTSLVQKIENNRQEVESETESHFALNESIQPIENENKNTEQVSESSEQVSEHIEQVTEQPLKPSDSTESLGSQRSVPRRRAAYKAAARIRRIAKQEAVSDSDDESDANMISNSESETESDAESTHTENLKTPVCSTRVCISKPDPTESDPVLIVAQIFLLLSLFLLVLAELANWMSPCTCPV